MVKYIFHDPEVNNFNDVWNVFFDRFNLKIK